MDIFYYNNVMTMKYKQMNESDVFTIFLTRYMAVAHLCTLYLKYLGYKFERISLTDSQLS